MSICTTSEPTSVPTTDHEPELNLGEELLKSTLDCSGLLDIKFFVFSKRLAGSDRQRVGHPRLVQAASSVIRHVEELNSRKYQWYVCAF